MTKKEVLADITRLVNGSESIDDAYHLIDRYMHSVCTLQDLAEFVAINDHKPDGRMTASGDGDDAGSGDDFEFGGAHDGFGGGGSSGSW